MLTVRRLPRSRAAVPALLGSLESTTALGVAHVVAGGEAPSLWWLAAFGVLVHLAGLAVLRGRASVRVVGPLLLGAQVLGHAWLVALAPGHHQAPATGGFLGLTSGMLVAHLLAVVVASAAWVLRRRAVAVVLAWSDPVLVRAPEVPCPVARTDAGPARRPWILTSAPLRGPPTSALATA